MLQQGFLFMQGSSDHGYPDPDSGTQCPRHSWSQIPTLSQLVGRKARRRTQMVHRGVRQPRYSWILLRQLLQLRFVLLLATPKSGARRIQLPTQSDRTVPPIGNADWTYSPNHLECHRRSSKRPGNGIHTVTARQQLWAPSIRVRSNTASQTAIQAHEFRRSPPRWASDTASRASDTASDGIRSRCDLMNCDLCNYMKFCAIKVCHMQAWINSNTLYFWY